MVRSAVVVVVVALLAVGQKGSRFVSAQTSCGSVGNDDAHIEAAPKRDRMLYLDTEHPATCSGNITSLTVCYYPPVVSLRRIVFLSTYAVYRRSETVGSNGESTVVFRRVTPTFTASRAGNGLPINNLRDGYIGDNFTCYDDSNDLSDPVAIRAGDVIGACIIELDDVLDGNFVRSQLDIVGEVRGQSLMRANADGCRRLYIPEEINEGDLTVLASRILHVRANILGMILSR